MVHMYWIDVNCGAPSQALDNNTISVGIFRLFTYPANPPLQWSFLVCETAYRKVSNISRTLIGNKIVDHSDDVVGASPVYGSAEGPPRGVENRNVLSHPDDLRLEAYLIRMT